MFDLLHFQQPYWMLLLIPLALILWKFSNNKNGTQSWANIINPRLQPLLLHGNKKQKNATSFPKWLLGIAWLIATIALADPVWEKVPRPIFQTNASRVIVLDLSNSMLVDDIKPTRMARARFKVEDILNQKEEGQIGLVVFAGAAFTASPLTRDADTIRALLQALTPSIMPSQGSRADLGLQKAHELLTQAGVTQGQVLLITDGASDIKKAQKIAKALKADSHEVSVLAVGTKAGGALTFSGGEQINISVDTEELHRIAKKGGGVLHSLTTSDKDLKAVLKQVKSNASQQKSDDLKRNDWRSTGPLIILLLLPLAALAFRKGWLFNILITATLVTTVIQPTPVMADDTNSTKPVEKESQEKLSWWKELFKNSEQRAQIALQNKRYDKASNLSNNPLRKGNAEYRKGNYEQALNIFKSANSADAKYNQGNALAKLKKYEEAIKAYEEALEKEPDMQDAKKNKKALEDLLKKKEEENKKQQEAKQDKEKKENEKKDSKKQDGSESQKEQGKKSKQKEGSDGKNSKEDDGKGDKENQFSKANEDLDQKKSEKKDAQKDQPEEESKKNAKEKKKESTEEQTDKKQEQATKGVGAEAEKLNKEEKMAAEQWLRRIPDDPGGLLRRKFKKQYRQRQRFNSNEQPW